MAKKKRSLPFDKRGGALVLQRRMLESSAYSFLTPEAKVLLLLLQTHWRNDKPVAYGVREAMDKIPCAKGTAQRAFEQVQRSGFAELVDESQFSTRTHSRARTWRLTWLPFMDKPPSNEWEKLGSPGQKCTL
ncbi:MAG: hypothetical protein V4751_11595 [Pseudomonadota bacterium]